MSGSKWIQSGLNIKELGSDEGDKEGNISKNFFPLDGENFNLL